MCDGRTCRYPCGEEEFRGYEHTLAPDQVVYPAAETAGKTRYGVMINQPAHQWKIVAVQANRPRHVAYISTFYCLDWVLKMAAGLSDSS